MEKAFDVYWAELFGGLDDADRDNGELYEFIREAFVSGWQARLKREVEIFEAVWRK